MTTFIARRFPVAAGGLRPRPFRQVRTRCALPRGLPRLQALNRERAHNARICPEPNARAVRNSQLGKSHLGRSRGKRVPQHMHRHALQPCLCADALQYLRKADKVTVTLRRGKYPWTTITDRLRFNSLHGFGTDRSELCRSWYPRSGSNLRSCRPTHWEGQEPPSVAPTRSTSSSARAALVAWSRR